MKITVVCGNGLGTSLMMEMSIKSILKDLSVSADVDHVDLGSAKGPPIRFRSMSNRANTTAAGTPTCVPGGSSPNRSRPRKQCPRCPICRLSARSRRRRDRRPPRWTTCLSERIAAQCLQPSRTSGAAVHIERLQTHPGGKPNQPEARKPPPGTGIKKPPAEAGGSDNCGNGYSAFAGSAAGAGSLFAGAGST